MAITGTLFSHKNIHKMTWRSPNGNTFNQIDHILIDVRHYSNILHTCSFRGANADTNHFLIVSKLRCKISYFKSFKNSNNKFYKYDVQKLQMTETK